MLVDFNCLNSSSIQYFTVKKRNDNVKITTRFLSGKMISLMSFIYDLVETLYFPNDTFTKNMAMKKFTSIAC